MTTYTGPTTAQQALTLLAQQNTVYGQSPEAMATEMEQGGYADEAAILRAIFAPLPESAGHEELEMATLAASWVASDAPAVADDVRRLGGISQAAAYSAELAADQPGWSALTTAAGIRALRREIERICPVPPAPASSLCHVL